ncbi:hypothetical protein [Nonomuraea jiangxiensis]|uniref:Uncharacterized protein n=1 Tax=Nonomuraea jiangxiensis TaxID=633440 RepID=A0A1G8FAC7_9ACTN|nr:hypothetical protein [Nonomuraea jiangxiensis]SDH79093.1 hypothetical protein SAMN05421869_103258 [Nonomuraea jiangxiensis]
MKAVTATTRSLIAISAGLALGVTGLLGTPPATAAAPPEGAYWHSRTLMTNTHPWRFGSKSHPYSLVQRRISEHWNSSDGREWVGFRELGTLPKSAADKKAWQRDGSPTKWSESIDGKTVKLSTEPAKGSMTPVRDENSFRLAGQRLTYDEVQRLPADPNNLKDWLTRAGQASRVPDGSLDRWVTNTLPQILHSIPAPKEVRTAAYQALLTMPGVRADGNTKDTLGRSGAAILIDLTSKEQSKDSTKLRLIIDTGKMVLLSQDQTVMWNGKTLEGKTHNQTLLEVGWTNSQPTVPALP